jgi:hypothetical protein
VNFYTTIEAAPMCEISLEKSYLQENRSHTISIWDPLSLHVKECVIDKSEKSSLSIRLTRNLALTNQLIDNRHVIIEDCDILNGMSYGISVLGEINIHQPVKIAFLRNRINNFKKDGIGVKNLNTTNMKIIGNEIKACRINGLYLQNIFDSQQQSQLMITDNQIYDSTCYGVYIKECSTTFENNHIYQNNKGGLFIKGLEKPIFDPKEHPEYISKRIIINGCNIHSNEEGGMILHGALGGPLLINSCSFVSNAHGILIKENISKIGSSDLDTANLNPPATENEEARLSSRNTSRSRDTKKKKKKQKLVSLGQISIENTHISQNKSCGVFINSLYSQLFIDQTVINENRDYAFILESQLEKHLVVFRDAERGKLREFVQGYIGGEWGELYEEKSGVCKGNKCVIF